MAALLMALDDPDGGPILVLAPKPLLQQWQDELMELLLLPSARWNGRAWVDENDLEYPSEGVKSLGKCPRRIGLVSQGLVVRGLSEAVNQLLSRRYTCVIVDEAHRARRRKVPKVDAGADEIDEKAEPNKLMAFLREIGPKTKSMLLATATPVQLHPVEAWDLLHILSHGNDGVLGGWTQTSPWFQPSHCLEIATGDAAVPTDDDARGWQYVRTRCRRGLKIRHSTASAAASMPATPAGSSRPRVWTSCRPPSGGFSCRTACCRITANSFNPLLRCIVRRTRAYLEATINPATGGYFLPKVTVKLFGEDDEGALVLGGYLREAYEEAENFSQLLQQRVQRCRVLQDAAAAAPGQFDGSRPPHRCASCWAKSPTRRTTKTRMTPKKTILPRSGRPPSGRQRFQELHRRRDGIAAALPGAAASKAATMTRSSKR